MECKLKRKEEKHILGWLGKPSWKLELLFSAVKDGCDPAVFHRLCDKKGPTVMVVWNVNGWMFGGYTSKDWDMSRNTFIEDQQAFMFRLKEKEEFKPIQFFRGQYATGIYCNQQYGPTFYCAQGEEYSPFKPKQEADNGRFQAASLNTYQGYLKTQITGTDAASSRSVLELCNNDKYFKDCHIYALKEMPAELEKPWRRVMDKWSEPMMQSLKEEIVGYTPPSELNTDRVNILMLGPVGAGKSSFFNTVNSVYRGHVTAQAVTGLSPHGLTTKYRKYEVRNRSAGGNLKVRLCDTLGLHEKQGLDVTDVLYILDGNVPDRFQFNPLARITPGTPGFQHSPTFSEKIHVTAFVLNAFEIDDMTEKLTDKLLAIRAQVNERGIPLVVLLTHTDLFLDEPDQLSRAFYNCSIQEAVDLAAAKVGVPKGHVLPVKNYESEIELDINVDILALVAMRQILRFADNFFDEQLDMLDQPGAVSLSKQPMGKPIKINKLDKLDQPN